MASFKQSGTKMRLHNMWGLILDPDCLHPDHKHFAVKLYTYFDLRLHLPCSGRLEILHPPRWQGFSPSVSGNPRQPSSVAWSSTTFFKLNLNFHFELKLNFKILRCLIVSQYLSKMRSPCFVGLTLWYRWSALHRNWCAILQRVNLFSKLESS